MRIIKKLMRELKVGDLILIPDSPTRLVKIFGVVVKKTRKEVGIHWTDDRETFSYESESFNHTYRVLA